MHEFGECQYSGTFITAWSLSKETTLPNVATNLLPFPLTKKANCLISDVATINFLALFEENYCTTKFLYCVAIFTRYCLSVLSVRSPVTLISPDNGLM